MAFSPCVGTYSDISVAQKVVECVEHPSISEKRNCEGTTYFAGLPSSWSVSRLRHKTFGCCRVSGPISAAGLFSRSICKKRMALRSSIWLPQTLTFDGNRWAATAYHDVSIKRALRDF